MDRDWRSIFWANAFSGYVATFARAVFGVILFRQLFEYLSAEEFGFWSLMWSIFGYAILLDFGLGFTVQKYVGQSVVKKDTQPLSVFISSIFYWYALLGLSLFLIFYCFEGTFLRGISVSSENYESISNAYWIFFLGMAFVFPVGVFGEVLKGLQRFDWVNWVTFVNSCIHVSLLLLAVYLGWSLAAIMGIAIGTTLLRGFLLMFLVYKELPGLRLSVRLCSWQAVRGQMGFSVVAYLITFSNMVMGQADQLVISWSLTVAYVALYQAGFRVADLLNMASAQLQAMISAAAVNLDAKGDRSGLQELFIRTSRLNWLLVTPLYVLAAVYMESLIGFLTKHADLDDSTYWVGQFLLLAVYSTQLTGGTSKRILLMCGREKFVLWTSIFDAVMNLTLSLIFVRYWGIVGVALGTCVPTILWGWGVLIPYTMSFFKLSFWRYCRVLLMQTWIPLLVFGSCLKLVLYSFPDRDDVSFIGLAWRGIATVLPLCLLSWPVIKSITAGQSSEAQ